MCPIAGNNGVFGVVAALSPAFLACLQTDKKKIKFLIIKDKKSRGFVAGFLLIIGAAFLLLVFAFVFAELRLPAMKAELRTAALTAHAQGCIAKTVPEYLPQTVCEKDGAETALSTYALGVLEAELTDALRKSLNGTAKAFVPLGNLTGLMLLNGRGMKIPVRFSVESAVSVRFESVLTGAGINRTAYRTVLHIEAVLFTAERDGAEPVTVTAAYPVYEAVLAGDVPQYGVVRAG